ncbi:MAG: HEAT repeat domain-containing protein [Edaphobacter sp.]
MTNFMRAALCLIALVLCATTQPIHASELELSFAPVVLLDDDAYAVGTRAMDEHRWPDAVSAFDKVINEKGKRVDAAFYWKAYSLNKLGKTPLAIATCDQLHSQFADSPWNKDCAVISLDGQVDPKVITDDRIKVKVERVQPNIRIAPFYTDRDECVALGSDDDLKMLALNSLLNRDPTTALPLLRGILNGNQPLCVKRHALFVLAQSKSPEAEGILHDAALGKLDPQLQAEAIRSIAVFQGKRANDTLAEAYRATTDTQIKKSIISAMFITKDAPRMVEMARNEKDLELKRTIVSQLALMNDKAATDYMLELLK